jgi:preprotein translocase subunit YajC
MNTTATSGSAQTIMQIVPILLIIVLFYALVILPQKKRQKKMVEFLASLKIGDRVVTGGGLVGTVMAIQEKQIEIEVAPNVVVTVMKQAVLTLAP